MTVDDSSNVHKKKCPHCGGKRLYCFFKPHTVPSIELNGYKIVREIRIVPVGDNDEA